MPSSLLNERSLVAWPGEVGEEESRMFGQQALRAKKAPVRDIWRRIFSLDKASVGNQIAEVNTLRERHSPVKKERKTSENWKPVKDKYNSNRFPSTILKYWKVVCIQKREKL